MTLFLNRLQYDTACISPSFLVTAANSFQSHIQFASEHPKLKELRDSFAPKATIVKDIAVLPIHGVLGRNPDPWEMMWGYMEDSTKVLSAINDLSANPDVRGILLDMDTPGGFVNGGPEIADAVRRASAVKPVVAHTSGLMASLGYWIGSQADAIVSSRSSIVGSIGVFTTHVDFTKFLGDAGIKIDVIRNDQGTFKAAGASGTALTDEQRSNLQEGVNRTFDAFRKDVVAKRKGVKDESMRGQTFDGVEAKSAGLVDRIGDIGFSMSVLRSMVRNRA